MSLELHFPSFSGLFSTPRVSTSHPPMEGVTIDSVSPKENSSLSLIDWNRLPVISNPSKADSVIGSIAKRILPVTNYALGGAALCATVCFSNSPMAVLTACTTLALASLGCHQREIFLHQQTLEEQENRKKQRHQIKNALEQDHGYTYIRTNFSHEAISDAELNLILNRDALVLPYAVFMQKHGKDSLTIVDHATLDILRSSFLKSTNWTLKNFSGFEEYLPLFSISKDSFRTFIAINEIQETIHNHLSYEEFIERNGVEVLDYVKSNYFYYRDIRSKFEQHVIAKGLGWSEIQQAYAEHLKYFSLDPIKVVRADLAKNGANQINYASFRNKHGFSAIAHYVNAHPLNLSYITSVFLKQPYETLISPEYEPDRQLLGLESKNFNSDLTPCITSKPLQSLTKAKTPCTEEHVNYTHLHQHIEHEFNQRLQVLQENHRVKINKIKAEHRELKKLLKDLKKRYDRSVIKHNGLNSHLLQQINLRNKFRDELQKRQVYMTELSIQAALISIQLPNANTTKLSSLEDEIKKLQSQQVNQLKLHKALSEKITTIKQERHVEANTKHHIFQEWHKLKKQLENALKKRNAQQKVAEKEYASSTKLLVQEKKRLLDIKC